MDNAKQGETMHSACNDTTTKAARRYVSPRKRPLTLDEAQTRALAYMLKEPDCDQDMIDAAAREMARLIEGERGYLVPVPSHVRSTTANRRLADAIAHMTGRKFETADVLSRTVPTDSSCQRHRHKLPPLQPEDHRIILAHPDRITLTGTDRVYFVDNVVTSGNTIEACRRVFFGLGTGLVFADACSQPRKK